MKKMLFKDPTIQKRGHPAVVRFLSVKDDSPEGLLKEAKRQYASMKKGLSGPDAEALRVYGSDFLRPYEKAYALVWEAHGTSLCLLLPDSLASSRTYHEDLEAIRLFVERNKFLKKSFWLQMQKACWFSEGKPGIRTVHCIRSFLRDEDHCPPEVRTLDVPCWYQAPDLPEGSYEYSRPVPFTVFFAGHRIKDPDSSDVWLSPHSPDEAIFFNDRRPWIM